MFMTNTELIKELKACTELHLNPYNLGDMGKTAKLITYACERLQKCEQCNVSGSLPPSSEKEVIDNIKYALSCYETYGTSIFKLFENIKELINEYCLGGNDR